MTTWWVSIKKQPSSIITQNKHVMQKLQTAAHLHTSDILTWPGILNHQLQGFLPVGRVHLITEYRLFRFWLLIVYLHQCNLGCITLELTMKDLMVKHVKHIAVTHPTCTAQIKNFKLSFKVHMCKTTYIRLIENNIQEKIGMVGTTKQGRYIFSITRAPNWYSYWWIFSDFMYFREVEDISALVKHSLTLSKEGEQTSRSFFLRPFDSIGKRLSMRNNL